MKKLLFLTVFIPFFAFCQQECFTETNILNADSVTYCIEPASCHSVCDGRIIITVVGDNQPYFFEWGSSGVSQADSTSQENLCAGNYSVLITDNSGNLVDFRSNIINEPSELGLVKALTNPSCFEGQDGAINITTLGDSPFTWSWDNGFNTEDLSGLSSGEYILTTIDSNECFREDTFLLSDPPEINVNILSDTLDCIGLCDGEAIIIPLEGIQPFTYSWANGETNDTTSNLCVGINNVIVSDSSQCFKEFSVEIYNPDTLKIENLVVDSTCFDLCDGEISLDITGGTSPYTFEFIYDNQIIDTLSTSLNNLCFGNYSFNFFDSNDCSASENIFVFEKDSFFIQSSIINDSCYNSCSGQITVEVLNANHSDLTFNWSNGTIGTNEISNLCADTINLEIIDLDLCRDTFEFLVFEAEKIRIDSFFIADNSCFGDQIGSISVNASGGTGLLQFNWSNSDGFNSANQDIFNLAAGTYNLNITDENNCSLDTIFNVNQPDSLVVTSSTQDVSCFNFSDGIIDLTIFGGVEPYITSWNTIISDSTYVDSLSIGSYIYLVTDSNNCFVEDTVLVEQPEQIIIDDNIQDVLCHGYSSGSIDLSVSGGTPSYVFEWSNSESSEDLDEISAGVYSLLLTDANNCQENRIFTITEPQFPITSNIIGNDVLCNGDNTGSASLSVTGGTQPYQYVWSNAENTQQIFNLTADTYEISIVDENGCDTTNSITITQNEIITINSQVEDVKCFGELNGEINILSTNGGVLPFTYLYSNGETTDDIVVPEGDYSLSITDAVNCSYFFNFTVEEPDALSSTITQTDIDCFGNNNGSIDFEPSGGTQPYNYLWSNNETTQDISGLSSGTYSVDLTDDNGCSLSNQESIFEPNLLQATVQVDNSICSDQPLGSAILTTSGGLGEINYSWSNGENTQNLIDVIADNYTVTISDENDCTIQLPVIITEPLPFTPTFTVVDLSCFGESNGSIDVLLSGNTPPYTYQWNNGANTPTINNLTAGDYILQVVDDNNCFDEFQITVNEPADLNINYTVYNASCQENDNGLIVTNISGGTLPYNYLWSSGETTTNLENINKGQYSFSVTDANNCSSASDIIDVNFEGLDDCIEIPSGFTPNNDGIHDEWSIYGLYNFPNCKISVYNRWGQNVFYSEGYSVAWDGKSEGVDMPIATYYYVLELGESGKVFNGTVTIKR
jgi:gliding motility-associated-like protein